MNVEFYDLEDEQRLSVATASWDGRDVTITASDDERRATLAHAFRRTPVAVEGAGERRIGTSGPAVLQPGDLEWFRAVASQRATAESGLGARFVPGRVIGGFDPAAGYRPFEEQVERLDARAND